MTGRKRRGRRGSGQTCTERIAVAVAAEREAIIALASRVGASFPADHPRGARASFADYLRVLGEEKPQTPEEPKPGNFPR